MKQEKQVRLHFCDNLYLYPVRPYTYFSKIPPKAFKEEKKKKKHKQQKFY